MLFPRFPPLSAVLTLPANLKRLDAILHLFEVRIGAIIAISPVKTKKMQFFEVFPGQAEKLVYSCTVDNNVNRNQPPTLAKP